MMRLTNLQVFSVVLLVCAAGTLHASSIPEQGCRKRHSSERGYALSDGRRADRFL
jgi:hypothetical protein